jgi:hypothetical protein
MGRVRVISDGEKLSLWDGLRRGELAGVDLTSYKVVIRDAKMLVGGSPEREGTSGSKLILTGGNRRESFGPAILFRGKAVDGRWRHEINKAAEEMR